MKTERFDWLAYVKVIPTDEEGRHIDAFYGLTRKIRYMKDLSRAVNRFKIYAVDICVCDGLAMMLFGQTYDGDIEKVLRFTNSSFSSIVRNSDEKICFRRTVVYLESEQKARKIFERSRRIEKERSRETLSMDDVSVWLQFYAGDGEGDIE